MKTKHKKKRNGDLNISHKCQTVRRLQSTPTSATLSPSLPPSILLLPQQTQTQKTSNSRLSPPHPRSDAQEKLAVTSRPHSNPQHHKNRSELRAREPRQEQLACSLARSQQHPRNTHARSHSRRHAQRRTRETVTGRSGRRGLGLPDSAG